MFKYEKILYKLYGTKRIDKRRLNIIHARYIHTLYLNARSKNKTNMVMELQLTLQLTTIYLSV